MTLNRGTFEVVQLVFGDTPPTSLAPIIKQLDRDREHAVNLAIDYREEDGEVKSILVAVGLKMSRNRVAFADLNSDATGQLYEASNKKFMVTIS